MSKLSDTSIWERRRIKGKVAVQKMVVDLMELYLHRLKQRRPPYLKSPAMAEFAAQFVYEPTPDQKQVWFIASCLFLLYVFLGFTRLSFSELFAYLTFYLVLVCVYQGIGIEVFYISVEKMSSEFYLIVEYF